MIVAMAFDIAPLSKLLLLSLLLALVARLSASAGSTSTPNIACRPSEFRCGNGRCVAANRYCDNVNDCGDSSDEPRFCTPCNRTYYGEVGKTYDMDLHRPREDKLPYICHLTFTATGGDLGDIVQLTFDSFTVGRFVSFTRDGCPDGALQLTEAGRPKVGGSWCGTSWGPAVYYSETRTVTVSVSLLRLNKDQQGYNFDFRMEYKMLRKDAATVRYGGINRGSFPPNATDAPILSSTPDYYLGDLISGTYCSRIFSDCDRRACRLQSPNFPGVYPRNLTCYYAVRQHDVPASKHALITVRQPKGQLISIRSQSALYGTSKTRELKVWSECDDVQDYVTVYDGYTTRDPVILKFCGGGEAVPEAVSSGHELLVEFTTSPYGTFLHPTPVQSLHGFQLEVEVADFKCKAKAKAAKIQQYMHKTEGEGPSTLSLSDNENKLLGLMGRTVIEGDSVQQYGVKRKVKFVDKDSPTYVKNKRSCEFWLRGTRRGVLESPQHSITANTTCLYHLQGVDMSVSPSPVPFRPLPPRYDSSGQWRRGGGFPPPRYRVWLSVLKFHMSTGSIPVPPDKPPCITNLKVWDGQLKGPSNCNDVFCMKDTKSKSRTSSSGMQIASANLLARYCQNYVPRSCEHSLLANGTRLPRPCRLGSESFLSTGDSLTVELRLAESTALRPVTFRALYEFVDLHEDGEPLGTGPCSRRFTSLGSGGTGTGNPQDNPSPHFRFQAPRNVFLYGRGGAHNISCVYRFEAGRDERVKITINKVIMSGRNCHTTPSADTGRLRCVGNTSATVRIFEVPWADVPAVPRDCLCSTETMSLAPTTTASPTSTETPIHVPYTYVSTSQVIELRFEVREMNATDDMDSLFFEGSVRFVRMPQCGRNTRKMGASGELTFEGHGKQEQVTCDAYPLVITPSQTRYLYVKILGVIVPLNDSLPIHLQSYQLQPKECYSRNRILIHVGSKTKVVCPVKDPDPYHHHRVVEVFSEGWTTPIVVGSTEDRLGHEPSSSVVVEFIGQERGSHVVHWLELSRRRLILSAMGMIRPEECLYRCPELNACINASVWCDGISDCPSGHDEALSHCSFLLQLPPLYLCAGALILLACAGTVCALAYKRCRRRPRSVLQTRLKSLSSSDTAIVDEKGVIC